MNARITTVSHVVMAHSRRLRKMATVAFVSAFSLIVHASHANDFASQTRVTLSPDGNLIAYVESEHGAPYFWIAQAHNPADRIALTVWNKAFVSYTWSSDSARIVFQLKDGNGNYELGVFSVNQKGVPVWYQGGANASLRRYVLADGGLLSALEVDGAGVRVRTFQFGEVKGRSALTIPSADEALMAPNGMLVAYHREGQWHVGRYGDYRETPDMRHAHIIGADNQAVFALTAPSDGVSRLMKYDVASHRETFLISLPASSTPLATSDASVRLIRPGRGAPWLAVDSRLGVDLAFAIAKGLGESERIQLAGDGGTWLLTLDAGNSPCNARYAIYYANDKAFALLFGPTGSALGSIH